MAMTAAVKNGYETTIITRLDMPEEQYKALQEKLTQVVHAYEGEIVLTEDWGKRKLAYLIENQNKGQYLYLVYTGNPSVVAELERQLKIQDNILRFLTIKLEDHFDAQTFCARREALMLAAKKREEDREIQRERYRDDKRFSYDHKE